jgi:hypothetical protein
MPGVHGIEHVESLFAAHLAHHNAIGAHTQAINHQLPLTHGAFSFNVWGPRLQPHHVFLLQLQFRRILDGNDTLGVGM